MASKIIRIRSFRATVHRGSLRNCLTALLLAAWFHPCLVRCQPERSDKVHVFTLSYSARGSTVSVSPKREEVRFRKEPDFANGSVLRRALVFGPAPGDFLGFAIDVSHSTLYLDLNRNLDLTDDPQGTFKGTGSPRALYFPSVRLSLDNDGVHRNYSMYIFVSGNNIGSAIVTSCYEGNIELQGKKWKLALHDNLDAKIDRGDQLVMYPAGAVQSLTYSDSIPVPGNLFLGGTYYRVNFSYGPLLDGFSTVRAGFEEISSPSGELILDGRFISLLVLEGNKGTAVLDSPPRSIRLPADKYRIQKIYLQSDRSRPRLSGAASGILQVQVADGVPSYLKVGGPLVSSVDIRTRGNILRLDYSLKGAGGEKYSVNSMNARSAPTFAIYQGNRRLAGGMFRFG